MSFNDDYGDLPNNDSDFDYENENPDQSGESFDSQSEPPPRSRRSEQPQKRQVAREDQESDTESGRPVRSARSSKANNPDRKPEKPARSNKAQEKTSAQKSGGRKTTSGSNDSSNKSSNKGTKEKPKAKPKPKETPLLQLERGKWRGGTTAERIQRVRWLSVATWRAAPFILVVLILLVLFGPSLLRRTTVPAPRPLVAPFFTREVQYWSPKLVEWGNQYGVDPNLIATLMQIESCGLPTANSSVGAQGLFQVMPFHFEDGENMTDPDTNAKRGVSVIKECLGYANGDPGLAMACYNGGPSLVYRDGLTWPVESQRYYTWGTGMYADATAGKTHSPSLDNWLDSGGEDLCAKAAITLNLPTLSPDQITPRPTPQPELPTVVMSAPATATPDTFIGAPPTLAIDGSNNNGNNSGNSGNSGELPTFSIITPTVKP